MMEQTKGGTPTPYESVAPLYEMIYAILRDHLTRGQFPPGLVLGEAAVARAFNTSRIPAGAALRRLRDDGLVIDFDGRGFLAGPSHPDIRPRRIELAEAGLDLPRGFADGTATRNRPRRIYPEVEHAVAACLAYGRFMMNESALAEHFGVSRSVAHEISIKLERAGLLVQDSNQRWYTAPLTADLLREHFEIRWLLEPIALRQAAPKFKQRDLERKHEHLARLDRHVPPPLQIERIEHELHFDIVGLCDNSQLRAALRRSQLPLLATHSTFVNYQRPKEIATLAAEHGAIFEHLLAGRIDDAGKALENHLRGSLEPNIELLLRLGPLPEELKLPYLQYLSA